MSSKTQRTYLAAAILTAAVGFYVYSHWKPGENPFSGIRGRNINSSQFDVPFARFRCAETLRSVQTPELVDAVRRVIEQNGLPADVFVDDTDTFDERKGETQPLNVAVMLHNEFHKLYALENPDNAIETLWDASPEGEWDVDRQKLDGVRATFVRLEPKRQAIRTALKQPHARFYYIFIYPDMSSPWSDAGIIVNTEASRYLSDYALLEEYAIAQALLDGNIGEAIDALAYVFRIAQLASHLANVGTRSDAAVVRLRAFDVMQRVILDPNFNRTHMVRLRRMLVEQHEDWVSEYITWFGDRASAIRLYHQLRLYLPVDVLEDDQFRELQRRGLVNEVEPGIFEPGRFDRGFEKHYEADHAFYLQSMQRILDVSEKPFVERLDVLDQIAGELFRKENTYDDVGIATEPFVANILLKDVSRLMQIFARDESALNRALVLTFRSLGQSNTDRYQNPFTGKPFEVHEADGLLSITIPELPRPLRMPVFTEQ